MQMEKFIRIEYSDKIGMHKIKKAIKKGGDTKMDKKDGILIICAVILFLCTVGTASAKTWYVDDSGGSSFTKIQDAITSANDGDTITVRDGNYLENVRVNKSLTIQSEDGSALTIIQAVSSGDHVFNVTANYVNISGFTTAGATGWDSAGIISLLCRSVQYDVQ